MNTYRKCSLQTQSPHVSTITGRESDHWTGESRTNPRNSRVRSGSQMTTVVYGLTEDDPGSASSATGRHEVGATDGDEKPDKGTQSRREPATHGRAIRIDAFRTRRRWRSHVPYSAIVLGFVSPSRYSVRCVYMATVMVAACWPWYCLADTGRLPPVYQPRCPDSGQPTILAPPVGGRVAGGRERLFRRMGELRTYHVQATVSVTPSLSLSLSLSPSLSLFYSLSLSLIFSRRERVSVRER